MSEHCAWCGKKLGGEIINGFLVDGDFCSDACLDAAEKQAQSAEPEGR